MGREEARPVAQTFRNTSLALENNAALVSLRFSDCGGRRSRCAAAEHVSVPSMVHEKPRCTSLPDDAFGGTGPL